MIECTLPTPVTVTDRHESMNVCKRYSFSKEILDIFLNILFLFYEVTGRP